MFFCGLIRPYDRPPYFHQFIHLPSRLPIDPSCVFPLYLGPQFNLFYTFFIVLHHPVSPSPLSFISHPLLTCCFLFPIVYM